MQPLSDTQAAFAAALTDAGAAVPFPVTSHAAARPKKRFDVYRNNVHASLIGILKGRYPVVARLVGDEFFEATARVFVDAHPPRSPVLMEYGAAFPAFLETFEPVDDLPYLPDVARIEWSWNFAYYAADAEPVSPEKLQAIAPAEIGGCRFAMHPSLSVIRSAWPVVTIWTANVEEGEPDLIDAGSGGEDAMILRPHYDVEVRHLPDGGALFVEALLAGATLQSAAERAQAETEAFDLTVNLAGLFQSGAVAVVET